MKKILLILYILLSYPIFFYGQITTPIIKARFGVDADLRANYFNGFVQTGNDDWFNNGTAGTGEFVIDTTGAAAMIAAYLADASPWKKRMSSFYRTMSKPPFSVVANRLWLDAIFVRDYHGTDTTVYTSGSDKNGMSPANWTGGIQGIPDKNDILDMLVHVRRAGPNTTDSLWMFGGVSLDNTTGNRYFDFEMYQTDIYYDRPSGKFYGYGADFGHTSWLFDASGNITRPGDIIFSGEFQSGTLSKIEARIWVKKTDWQTIVPASFNYSGLFDGASSVATYGYASITPNSSGAFYTGLGSASSTWAGPFGLILQDNSLAYTSPAPASTTNSKYLADQFIEFSVNLTKLGLDPVTLLGGDICGTPFNRIVVKTRASASFTSELKDFVAPTDLFLAPRAILGTQTPYVCDSGSISRLYVTDSVSTSTYTWSTPNGNIVGSTTGASIYVDTAGTYIVKQYLQAGCSLYASDTIVISRFTSCYVLANNLVDFKGALHNQAATLNWSVLYNEATKHFNVERSVDGINFSSIATIQAKHGNTETSSYSYDDPLVNMTFRYIYYRLRISDITGIDKYSVVVKISITTSIGAVPKNTLSIMPNPVKEVLQLFITAVKDNKAQINIYDQMGKKVHTINMPLEKGNNVIAINDVVDMPIGIYNVVVIIGNEIFTRRILLKR